MVYIFVRPAAGWMNETEAAELTAAGSGDLGISVAIVGDTILAGARNTNVGTKPDVGAAYVFGP